MEQENNSKNNNTNNKIVDQQLSAFKQELRNEFRTEMDSVKNENSDKINALKEELAKEREKIAVLQRELTGEKTDKLLLLYKLETLEQKLVTAELGTHQRVQQPAKEEFTNLESEKVSEEDWQKQLFEQRLWETMTKMAALEGNMKKMQIALEEMSKQQQHQISKKCFDNRSEEEETLLKTNTNTSSTITPTIVDELTSTEEEEHIEKMDDNSIPTTMKAEVIKQMNPNEFIKMQWNGTNHWISLFWSQDAISSGPYAQIEEPGFKIKKLTDDKKWTNVRAKQPFLRDFHGIAYYEVTLKGYMYIGWADPDFPMSNRENPVGQLSGSYAINPLGYYYESTTIFRQFANNQLNEGDTVGTGLVLCTTHQESPIKIKLFFTRNGQLINGGKLFELPSENNDILYPVVSLYTPGIVDTNFGADPGKPFQFNIGAHKSKLFV